MSITFLQFLTSLQQVFKMFICNSACMHPPSRFLYSLMAASVMLCSINETLLKLIDTDHITFINSLLRDIPHLHWI